MRKRLNLTQSQLAQRFNKPRTQAWVSTVEAGKVSINITDLIEIAAILGATATDLIYANEGQERPRTHSLNSIIQELNQKSPLELPVYLQRQLSNPASEPIDYQYSSKFSGYTILGDDGSIESIHNQKIMVVERYYAEPLLNITDLLSFSTELTPHADLDTRASDRVIAKLNKPYSGLEIHPAIFNIDGSLTTQIRGESPMHLKKGSYEILGVPYMIRAESCDVIVKQDIQTIGDVDGSIDYTRYMLQPFDVSGSLSFPLDQSQAADSFAVFEKLYNDAVLRRSEDGNLRSKNEGGRRLHVRYYPGFSYTYLDILINSFQLSVSQGDVLKATVNMMGRGRIPMDPSDAPTLDATSDLAPVRAIQFNDVEVVIVPDGDIGGISEEISTEIVRSFEVTINNNCEHVYTLSSSLTPYDIIAKKREITGSVTFAGRQDDLAVWAAEHEARAQSAVDLVFRVKFGP
ncbi:MAG: phage tail tube protein, partial [Anaerolineales bacterium]|nr:phage tail tube protein [Anaerolineales bacterium]